MQQKANYLNPIFLYNVNINHPCEQFDTKTLKMTFKVKTVNRYKSKLYLSNENVHTEMMSLLKEKIINSYSFTSKKLKQFGTEAKEIISALDSFIDMVMVFMQ